MAPLHVLLLALLLGAPRAEEEREEPAPLPEPVVTEHTATVRGVELAYRATAGMLRLRQDGDEPRADVFFVAYDRLDDPRPGPRPVTFCFNGGPGSSSVWLHLGAFAPRRVDQGPDPSVPRPPFRLVENPHSILDATDLVFVDPVTTGYSRAVEGVDDADFHGVEEDVRWVAEFVRLYTTRYERWDAPKFLAGESYGTTRVAALADHLQSRHGMYLNGVILVSSILSFQTARFDPGNDLPYVLFLPTYAATAWFHGAVERDGRDLAAFLDEVEAFALGEYSAALLLGDRLPDERRAALAERLAAFTGLDPGYLESTNLRIDIHRFVKELRRDERLTVGRLDSRFTGRDADAAGEHAEYDPSYAAIQGSYTAALNHYVRTELGYESDVPYEILSGRVQPWNWTGGDNRYVDTGHRLRRAMTVNPHLSVYVANGYYDLATPYFATEHTFAHLGLEPALRGNVRMGYFEAGHMMYVDEASLAALGRDLEAFYEGAAPR